MKKIKKTFNRAIAFLTIFVISAAALPIGSLLSGGIFGATSKTLTVTYTAAYFEGHHYGGSYTVTIDSQQYKAFCMQAKETAPTKSELTVTVSVYEVTDDYVRAAMYFGYDGPQEIDGVTEYGTHQVVSWYFSAQTTLSSLTSDYAESAGIPTLMEYVEEHKDEVPDSFHVYYCYPSGTDYQAIGWWEYEPSGYLNIKKVSANTSVTDDNSNYSLENAQYTVYTDQNCTSAAQDINGNAAVLTLDSSGETSALEMTCGTYYVKETQAPSGYEADESVYEVSVVSGETVWVNLVSVSDTPLMISPEFLLIKKSSESESEPISGAVYKISFYADDEISSEPAAIWYLESDDEGYIKLSENYLADGYESSDFYYDEDGNCVLPLGCFCVQEVYAPDGYLIDDEIYSAKVIEDSDAEDLVSIVWDESDSENLVIATASFGQYAVHYENMQRSDLELYKTDSDGEGLAYIPFLITRTWTDSDGNEYSESQIIVTDENGYFSSKEREKSADNVNVLSVDEYVSGITFTGTDEELISASSYNIWFGDEDDADSSKGSLLFGDYTVTELACSTNEGKSLVSKTFTVSAQGQSDETEIISITMVNMDIEITTTAVSSLTGTKTVFAGEQTPVCDIVTLYNLCSSATYKLYVNFVDEDFQSVGSAWSDEFSVEKGAQQISVSVEVTADTSAFTQGGTITALVYLYQEVLGSFYEIASHADMADEDEQLTVAVLETTAMDLQTGDHIGQVGESTCIIDTVYYENLSEGENYLLKAELVDEDGNVYASASGEFYVYADTAANRLLGRNLTSGEIEVSFSDLYSIDFEGKTLYVNEKLYWINSQDGTYVLVIDHDSASLKDADQAVYYPCVQTTASDNATGTNVGKAQESTQISDVVVLSGLVSGQEYSLTGSLRYVYDFTDADGIFHEAGSEAEASLVSARTDSGEISVSNEAALFEASESEMTITLVYEIDTSAISGATVVVFEDLIHNDTIVYSHSDLTDKSQSIYYPKIATSAADYYTQTNVGACVSDNAVTDTVSFENLICGNTYVLSACIYDRESSLSLLNGGLQITKDLTIEVSEGGAITLSDESESVTFSYDEENNTVSGSVSVSLTGIDAQLLSGTTEVVFERLYYIDPDTGENILVAFHTELLDENQAVHYPQITTSAADSDTENHTGSLWGTLINKIKSLITGQEADDDKMQKITDSVSLSNLIPGQTYTLRGILMDRNSQGSLTVNDEEITSFVTFTVSEDGTGIDVTEGSLEDYEITGYSEDENYVDITVKLSFSFDSSLISEEVSQIVVFERLYFEDILVAQHTDFEDEDQLINEISVSTKALCADTEDHVGSSDGEITITDTISLADLVPGSEYTVTAVLVDEAESSKDGLVYVKDENGCEISKTITFKADSEDENFEYNSDLSSSSSVSGTLCLTFSFESNTVSGHSVTVAVQIYHNGVLLGVFGYSYDEDGELIFDSDESIYFPAGKTSASDSLTLAHISDSKSETVITDLVYFENLVSGKEYTITGTLHYAQDFTDLLGESHSSGQALTTADEYGNVSDLTSPVTFIASDEIKGAENITVTTLSDGTQTVSGYISLEFIVDTCLLSGASLVVFEDFIYNGVTVFAHADISDSLQSILIPEISTSAFADSSLKEISAGTYYEETGTYTWNTVTITDTVSYTNLLTSSMIETLFQDEDFETEEYAAYAVCGYLVYEETGEEVLTSSGERVSAYCIFSPEEQSGYIDVVYTLDLNDFLNEDGSCYLEEQTLVVYEDLYYINKDESDISSDDFTAENHIAQHKDKDDEAQAVMITKSETVNMPKTGDESEFLIWLLTGLLALSSCLCSTVLIKRMKN